MADNVIVNIPDTVGATIATDDISGVQHQKVKVEFGSDGVATMVDAANPLPTTDAAAEASLASIDGKLPAGGLATSAKQDTGNTSLASIDSKLTNPLPVSGTVAAVVAGTVAVSNFPATQPISAAALPLPSGAAIAANQQTDALTNTQLRAAPVPVDVTANTIGLALEATQLLIKAKTDNLDVALSTRNLEATQLLVKAKTDNLDVALSTRLKAADTLAGVTAVGSITNALPAGSAIIGKVGIDQTTPGTTNGVQVNAALPAGTNVIGHVINDAGSAIIGKVGIDQTTPGTTNAVAIISGQAGVAANDGNVDALTQRVVIAANVLSTNNSSTATLAANAIFTGTSDEIISYNEARISVYSDVASLTDGLSIQQSTDNTNWIIADTYTIAAATGKTFSVPRQARYFRIVYTNGGAAQATFILQVSYSRIAAKSSSQRASDNYTNQTDLEQQQAFLMNYNQATDSWYRVRGDASGLLVNPNGFNVDYQRKMQEQQVLYAYSALMEEMGATERYNSSRDFIEIR